MTINSENKILSLLSLFRGFSRHIPRRRKIQLCLVMVLMLLVSLSEIINIGAVLPFLGVLIAPEQVFRFLEGLPFFSYLGLTSYSQLLLPLTLIFGIAILITVALRLMLLWGSTKLSYSIGAELSEDMYRRTLYQPYLVHINRNTSEVINGISSKVSAVIIVLNLLMTFIGNAVMLISVMVVLIIINPTVAILCFGGFGLIYLCIVSLTKKRVLRDGERISQESTLVIKTLQEGLGGIRDVLLDGTQEEFCRLYNKADLGLRRAQGSNSFLAQFPRYGLEAVGMILIITWAYYLASDKDIMLATIPFLGALALGAQRFLPAFQQMYGSWTGIIGSKPSLVEALNFLEQPLPTHLSKGNFSPMPFRLSLEFKDVSFQFPGATREVFSGVGFKVPKGARVGVVGKTGGGKSTLMDLVMGLLSPSVGLISVDGVELNEHNLRSWQGNIAHVPQYIFLLDGTIEENIAFGVATHLIDQERIKLAAQQAQLDFVIDGLPEGYKSLVGERGVKLSGGQRQRIGIARALYKKAEIIIFDEATNALDSQTEESVMSAIDNLSPHLTLFMVAHRLSTLKNCSQFLRVENGLVHEVSGLMQIENE